MVSEIVNLTLYMNMSTGCREITLINNLHYNPSLIIGIVLVVIVAILQEAYIILKYNNKYDANKIVSAVSNSVNRRVQRK